MTEPAFRTKRVPKSIAVCPECSGQIYAECVEWIADTGKPTETGIVVSCRREEYIVHKFWQSDWQPTLDVVNRWARDVRDE